jgi:integrase
MPKLLKSYIDRIKPAPKETFHWDELAGFGLRVSPLGKLSFIVQGVVKGTNDSIRLTIGQYGVFTPDQAREVAKEHLRSMRLGIDPRLAMKADAAMKTTLQQVCDQYLDRPGKLKESSKIEMRRHIEKVFESWKDRPIVAISEDDVRKRHRELVEHGLRGKKAAPASANSAMVTLRILINFANRQYRRADGSPLIPRNPIEVLKDHWAPLGSRTKRYIDKSKIGEAWNKLNEARATARSREVLAGIDLAMFLLLTGARLMEGAALTWDRVNLDNTDPANCWFHLPNPKNGREVFLPISSQAVALLKARRVPGPRPRDKNPFVFPSRRTEVGHITDPRLPLKIVSEVAGQHLSCHDLRRTFTNITMRECLIEKFRCDLMQNHVPAQEDVTSRHYLDLSRLTWLQPDVQKIGDYIEQQAERAAAIAAANNVTVLTPRNEAA